MKSMRLYHRVERIFDELRARGLDDDAALSPSDLTDFDQYHYDGTAAVEVAIARLGLTPAAHVLDIGAGIGGPARFIAAQTGCRVTALELQADVDAVGRRLTARCGLGDRVQHVCGDILDGPPLDGAYDAIVSYLVFLHIPDRARLFGCCARALRPGGAMVIEDFTCRRAPTATEAEDLRVKVMTPYVPDPDRYLADLEAAGFDTTFEDLSTRWTAFTAGRLQAFRRDRARHLDVHGRDVVDGLDDFYATVARLYADGVLGGARIVAHLRPG